MLIDIKQKVYSLRSETSISINACLNATNKQTNKQTNDKVCLCVDGTADHHDNHHRMLES